jgi:thiamine-phosphate pyrophosphorylase
MPPHRARSTDLHPSKGRRPILCLVTNRAASRRPLAEVVEIAVASGVDWIQVRERELEDRPLLDQVDRIRRAAGERARVLVNRRVDVALAARADGVHLGFDGMPPETARELLGVDALIGIATHQPGELEEAVGTPLSYAHLAPIFPPLSKAQSRTPLGLAGLREAARHGVPVLAQGGIEADNAGPCIEAGAAGIAVTGSILSCADPAAATRALREALDASAPLTDSVR